MTIFEAIYISALWEVFMGIRPINHMGWILEALQAEIAAKEACNQAPHCPVQVTSETDPLQGEVRKIQ